MKGPSTLCASVVAVALAACANAPPLAPQPRDLGQIFGTIQTGPAQRLPNGGRPLEKIAFPDIQDWNSLTITLMRGPCEGTCRSYSVEIHGDGSVLYTGEDFVAIPGPHRAHIDPAAVRDLFQRFRDAEYFWLFDSYYAPVIDYPQYETSISFDGRTKRVRDNAGQLVGIPQAVRAMENAIDDAAGAEKWTRGNAQTIAALKAEGWNFGAAKSPNTDLVAAAAEHGSEDLAIALLNEGAPIGGLSPFSDGETALMAAAEKGYLNLIALLFERGADVNERGSDNMTALMAAAQSGIPQVVSAILQKHPVIDAVDADGRTAFMYAAENFTSAKDNARIDRPQVVRLLVAAGANPKTADKNGDTALTGVSVDADVAKALLQLGADPNQRGHDGITPLEQSYDPAAVRVLLEGGADAFVMHDGKTVADIVRARSPELRAVMDAWVRDHPRPAP